MPDQQEKMDNIFPGKQQKKYIYATIKYIFTNKNWTLSVLTVIKEIYLWCSSCTLIHITLID